TDQRRTTALLALKIGTVAGNTCHFVNFLTLLDQCGLVLLCRSSVRVRSEGISQESRAGQSDDESECPGKRLAELAAPPCGPWGTLRTGCCTGARVVVRGIHLVPFYLVNGIAMGCRPTRVGSNGLLNEVNRDPQADPDNVDEVPVVRHDDGSGCLCRGELGLERPEQHNKERNHTGQHVCAVETGRDEEHRAVNGAGDRGSSLDEVEVLVSLTDKEHGSQQRRQCVPTTKSEDIPPLSRENAELRSHGR